VNIIYAPSSLARSFMHEQYHSYHINWKTSWHANTSATTKMYVYILQRCTEICKLAVVLCSWIIGSVL